MIKTFLYLKEYETEFWEAVGKVCEKHGQKEALVYAGISEEEKSGRLNFRSRNRRSWSGFCTWKVCCGY